MNYSLVLRYLGYYALAAGGIMLPSLAWTLYFQEWDALRGFLMAMAVAGAGGGFLAFTFRNPDPGTPEPLYQREALVLVTGGWLMMGAVGALPFIFAGVLGPVDALFESISGFTTTGATVLMDIEAVDKSILFWRSMTQWIGGMGVILLFIAILPYLGAGGKQLFRSEFSGPDPRGLRPRIQDTAFVLYSFYLSFSLLETALLMIAGMGFYDALCHTFSTLSTGGFSPYGASIGAFNSPAIEYIIIVFMVLGGTNFGLYFAVYRGDWFAPFKNTEWRFFILVAAAASLIIAGNILGMQLHAPYGAPFAETAAPHPDYSWGHAVRASLFNTVSIMTSTGFITEDYDAWPYFSRYLLVILMCIGACAGSTSGGIKSIRIYMLFKMAYWNVEKTFRPRTIRALRIGPDIIDEDIQRSVSIFFVLNMFLIVGGTLFMCLQGLPTESALTSITATLFNCGPGLQYVGGTESYGPLAAEAKLFLALYMVVGRLELFSVLVLFMPGFWKRG